MSVYERGNVRERWEKGGGKSGKGMGSVREKCGKKGSQGNGREMSGKDGKKGEEVRKSGGKCQGKIGKKGGMEVREKEREVSGIDGEIKWEMSGKKERECQGKIGKKGEEVRKKGR